MLQVQSTFRRSTQAKTKNEKDTFSAFRDVCRHHGQIFHVVGRLIAVVERMKMIISNPCTKLRRLTSLEWRSLCASFWVRNNCVFQNQFLKFIFIFRFYIRFILDFVLSLHLIICKYSSQRYSVFPPFIKNKLKNS